MGNDGLVVVYLPAINYFNPRSHVGNDHFHRTKFLQLNHISIHVPTWGTTEIARHTPLRMQFQSTFPRGERHGAPYISYSKCNFNPRSHVGNDSRTQHRRYCHCDFNPRSHVGNDSKFSQIFFAFLCNKYNFSTFYYPFSLFFGVIHFTFLIFAVRILPIFYVYF